MSEITERELRALGPADQGRRIFDGRALRGEVKVTTKGVSVAFA